MDNQKKIPWWVQISRIGMPDDNYLLLFTAICVVGALPFFIFVKNGGTSFIIYGSCLIAAALMYAGSYLWLKKNNQLEK